MNLYGNFKSPLGYQTGEGQIDTYGVDHSGFSTRDELEYQFARQDKENQLIQNYNNQGITKNYPQYGTNFWGGSSNDNYGFGFSNIHDNIENRNNNPFENTVNTFGQNQTEQSYGLGSENQTFGQENNNSPQWGLNNTPLAQNNNNTFSNNLFGNNNLFNQNQSVWNKNQYQTPASSRYNLKDLTDRLQQYQNNALGNSNSTLNSGLNNGSIFSPNNMQSLNLNASSVLYPQQNSFSTYSQPYQLAQNSLPNSGSDVNNLVKPKIIFDDVYYSELGEDGSVVNQGTNKHEGGYSDRLNDLGGPTNYGVRQAALNEYNNWNSPLRTGFNFPIDVEKLTPKQAKQIMDEMYYQRYNINKLQNLKLARNTFDAEVNQGPYAGKMLANAMNEFYGYIPNQSEKFFYRNIRLNDNLANAVNNLTPEETIKVNDILAKLRMEKYFQSVDENPIQNVNNINGWYNRAKSYYSNSQEFERLYKHRVDDYIKNKYPQFYNGK